MKFITMLYNSYTQLNIIYIHIYYTNKKTPAKYGEQRNIWVFLWPFYTYCQLLKISKHTLLLGPNALHNTDGVGFEAPEKYPIKVLYFHVLFI